MELCPLEKVGSSDDRKSIRSSILLLLLPVSYVVKMVDESQRIAPSGSPFLPLLPRDLDEEVGPEMKIDEVVWRLMYLLPVWS
ncbi:UNVERIFIED_CONTAM: hypothetical protein PYX00_009587 [Menopon gallinae]|uniref:Uncharacterized protein n=1 Tax=Menopon gallinae TaxID=328185 RepID=A0AAW2HC24_9NEOP